MTLSLHYNLSNQCSGMGYSGFGVKADPVRRAEASL